MKIGRCFYLALHLATCMWAVAAPQDRTWDLDVGVGPLMGHTTYRIGGTVVGPAGVDEYWFPISELVFPMNVAQVTLDSTLRPGRQKRLLLSVAATKNLTTDAGVMEDSDWTTGEDPDRLDIFSESDAELDTLMLNAEIVYMFLKKKVISVGAGAGFLYQEFNYECNDFDQWYPSQPGLGHDYGAGLGIIYDVTYHIPYLQVRSDFSLLKGRARIGLMLGLSPYLAAEDYDNHVFRGIEADGDYDGLAALLSLEGTFRLFEHWFLEARLETRNISATGTQRNYIDGAWVHDIDAELTSDQAAFTLAAGASF